ncbi:MAG: hypothetical protein WCG80_18635 [Spirochaetales bacterium]
MRCSRPWGTVLAGFVLTALVSGCATLPEETSYRQNSNTTVHTNRFGVVYIEQLVPDPWGEPITVRYIVDKN